MAGGPDGARITPLAGRLGLLLLGNVVLTLRRPTVKRAVVATVQRCFLNPVVRALFRIGFVPFGYVLLETVGRRTGRARHTPVGNGMEGDVCWIVAEHGAAAGYVRNVLADPRVRLQVREGHRFVWRTGTATVLPDDDPLRRQRTISRRHPLRLMNAVVVRTLGTDLLTVRVDLDRAGPRPAARAGRAAEAGHRPTLPVGPPPARTFSEPRLLL